MVATLKTEGRTRHGLIALIAIRQAQAIREREAREAAERAARKTDADAEKPKKKRGWFR